MTALLPASTAITLDAAKAVSPVAADLMRAIAEANLDRCPADRAVAA